MTKEPESVPGRHEPKPVDLADLYNPADRVSCRRNVIKEKEIPAKMTRRFRASAESVDTAFVNPSLEALDHEEDK